MKAESKEYYIALLSLVLGSIIILFVTHLDFKPVFKIDPFNLWWLLLPLGLGILGLGLPKLMVQFLKGIQFVQHKIGTLITYILLTVVFYIFLTPIAFLSRLFTKRKAKSNHSNFVERNHTYVKGDMKKSY